jgi:hypothetical protein
MPEVLLLWFTSTMTFLFDSLLTFLISFHIACAFTGELLLQIVADINKVFVSLQKNMRRGRYENNSRHHLESADRRMVAARDPGISSGWPRS